MHRDNQFISETKSISCMSILIYLTDDFEGGDTAFFKWNGEKFDVIRVKPKVVFFFFFLYLSVLFSFSSFFRFVCFFFLDCFPQMEWRKVWCDKFFSSVSVKNIFQQIFSLIFLLIMKVGQAVVFYHTGPLSPLHCGEKHTTEGPFRKKKKKGRPKNIEKEKQEKQNKKV